MVRSRFSGFWAAAPVVAGQHVRRDRQHAVVGLAAGDQGGHGGRRVGHLLVGLVGLGVGEIGEPLEAQGVLLPLHPLHLPVQDARRGDRGHAHAVADEQDDVPGLLRVRRQAQVGLHLGPGALACRSPSSRRASGRRGAPTGQAPARRRAMPSATPATAIAGCESPSCPPPSSLGDSPPEHPGKPLIDSLGVGGLACGAWPPCGVWVVHTTACAVATLTALGPRACLWHHNDLPGKPVGC